MKAPPAAMSPPGMTARAWMYEFSPSPRGDQAAPSQRATAFTPTVPAASKTPPAITLPLGSAVNALTPSKSPVAIADHDPFHRAMRFTCTPPAVSKKPPAISSPLGSASTAETVLFNVPMDSHDVPLYRTM